MKNFKSRFALTAMALLAGVGSLLDYGGGGSVISPYSNDYSTPSVRKYSPDERRTRKRANRQKRHSMKMKRGWA